MRKKKNCNGCAALETTGCRLNYRADIRTEPTFINGIETHLIMLRGTPLDICPKPRTITRLVSLSLEMSRDAGRVD